MSIAKRFYQLRGLLFSSSDPNETQSENKAVLIEQIQ